MTTEVIVTETNNTVVINTQQPNVIVSGMIGPTGVTSFSGLTDIDLNQLSAGSVLVYNAGTQKWTATKLLDQQIVESGQF
jgi:NADPH-dependent curcumin reductase CurA